MARRKKEVGLDDTKPLAQEPNAVVNDLGELSPEEEAELALQKQAIIAKRQNINPRVCRVCNQYAPGTGICANCQKESEECPLCGNKNSLMVCRVCMASGAPWCKYCRRVRPANASECEACASDFKTLGAANYRSPVMSVGMPSGELRVYEAAAPGAEMPAPTTEIPV